MLAEFIEQHREQIIALARNRVAQRTTPRPSDEDLEGGVPVFLDQLRAALSRTVGAEATDEARVQLGSSAALHGHGLLGLGLTIAQVVHGYGDICQVITALAVTEDASIEATEFRILNLCLDEAIAAAVTAYAAGRARAVELEGVQRLGAFAHELRNLLSTASLAFDSIRSGQVAPSGSTAALLDRALLGLGHLVAGSLAGVRLESGLHPEQICVAELLEEAEISAVLHARARGVRVVVAPVDARLSITGDRQTVAAAIENLMHNAFKFTRKRGNVSLSTRVTEEGVLFSVEDECGGLPPGKAEDLFRPFEQRSADRSGMGLGLAIARKAARANGGELSVRDLPGKGCVFTLEMPRAADTAACAPTPA